ncbi:endosome/lysosome-associated apoptosis and autophagy regulator 1 isoform X2 [Paramormyrops kingsleyae]|uniref:endosome/lysosome-associated apoptosis and autophagy regulator 1 isoform X2 n=1 Tax=Paramormyrops kingsleyae TaxID=1676925 RepID=UPI003B96A496
MQTHPKNVWQFSCHIWCFFLFALEIKARDLPMCKESDFHFEYTECDVLGSRWRVAVPNKPDTCTGLPDPVRGTECSFSCKAGEFLDMETQECQKCAAGTFSLGTGVWFDDWDHLPAGFFSYGADTSMGTAVSNCSNSTWLPKGDYIASNSDECSSTLTYAVNLKQTGSVSFEYFYADNSVFFEFYVQNDQCQSTESESRWMKSTQSDWDTHYVELSHGNNVLYWRTTGFSMGTSSVKPVLLRNVAIKGVAYTSECFHCKPGTYSGEAGAARCAPCPANTYSNKGATSCQSCAEDFYSGIGSGSCEPRPVCKESDYFYTHMPCDSSGKTQLMFKWIEPKICSENSPDAARLPASGAMEPCRPCNPGYFPVNGSGCEACPPGSYSNGSACEQCPAGTEPILGFEYKWWNTMPGNMKTSVYSREYSDSDRTTAWEVAGEYIYTTPGDVDSDYVVLMLTVPGYRPAQLTGRETHNSELSRISFVFETKCTADCMLFFSAGPSEWSSQTVEHWEGSRDQQSYSYIVRSNDTTCFTWAFQRTRAYGTKQYLADLAKLYYVKVSNVIGGVASGCRRCLLDTSTGGVSPVGGECVPCPAGHYMPNDSSICRSCPDRTIVWVEQPVGEEACQPCGPNTQSNEDRTACVSDCTLSLPLQGGGLAHYDFSSLANTTHFHSSARFTSKGLRYFHQYSVSLCGNEGGPAALCVDNVTESKREVKGHVCQSTVVPSQVRGQRLVSSQPFSIGDTLIGITADTVLDNISSPTAYFPTDSSLPDVIFYYRSAEATLACKKGRSSTIRMRCDPSVLTNDQLSLPSMCSEGTCDGCSFHFLWRTRHACPLCSAHHYKEIISGCDQGIQRTTYVWQQPLQCSGGIPLPAQKLSACVTLDFWLKFGVLTGGVAALLLVVLSCYFWKRTRRLQYKYSKLITNTGETESDLPAADSCAIMEGEDAEDDLIYLTKRSIYGKIKSFSRQVCICVTGLNKYSVSVCFTCHGRPFQGQLPPKIYLFQGDTKVFLGLPRVRIWNLKKGKC